MAKKRDRTDILEDMLASIQDKGGEIKPTHLMYRSNLSHKQMNSYLEELITRNFVARVKKNNYDYIIITDQGSGFLQKIRELREFERSFGLGDENEPGD